jgi:polygalacturonase
VRLTPTPVLFFSLFALAVATGQSATISIADRGAVADGKTLNTVAIQRAVDECTGVGGGTVLVPAGVWLTGGIQLKSSVTLRLEAGAILRGSADLADYPANGFKHPEMSATTSLLWAIKQKDITLCGEGTIELADQPFFDWNLLRTGLPADKDALLQDWQRRQCVVTALARPSQPIFFHDCEHLRFEGITVRNSPCWTFSISCCDDVQVHGLRIDNNLQIPNDDGMHFSGSKNIVISDCIIRGGDDCLAFTAITDPSRVCENITVTNCILTSRSAGIHVGFNSAKVRNVTLSNLILRDCNRGIIVQCSDNGSVENVEISNIVMDIRMYAGAWWGKGEPIVISAADSDSARIRGVSIHHVRGSAQNSILIVGKNHNVSDISLEDIQLSYSYSPNVPLYGQALDLAPASPRPAYFAENKLPWLYAESVADLRLRDISVRQTDATEHKLALEPVLTDVVK